jgi:hypothetical protein
LELCLLLGELLGFQLRKLGHSPNLNYHVIWSCSIPHNHWIRWFIRWFLGDDLMRILLDRRRPVSAREVLFSSKRVVVIKR